MLRELVASQVAALRRAVTTEAALERPLSCVRPQVILQQAVGRPAFATKFTLQIALDFGFIVALSDRRSS